MRGEVVGIEVGVGLDAPAEGGGGGEAGIAHTRLLVMAHVTPVGDEEPGRTVGDAGRRPRRRCSRSCCRPAPRSTSSSRCPGTPRTARRRRRVAWRARSKGWLPSYPHSHTVTPSGSSARSSGCTARDVAPHEQLPSGQDRELPQGAQPLDPFAPALGARAPRARPGRCAPGCWRRRDELAEEVRHERERLGVGRVEGECGTVDPEDPVEAVGRDGQRSVALEPEPTFVVAEGVLVGDELDATRPAVRVEGTDVERGVGIGAAPDVLVAGIGEGVLHVQLELVDLPARQPVDEAQERGHGRARGRVTRRA